MEFVTDGDVLVAERTGRRAGDQVRPANVSAGLPVWVIIDSARVVGFDSERIAERYGLSTAEVESAFQFYADNKPLVDAQISTCVESYL